MRTNSASRITRRRASRSKYRISKMRSWGPCGIAADRCELRRAACHILAGVLSTPSVSHGRLRLGRHCSEQKGKLVSRWLSSCPALDGPLTPERGIGSATLATAVASSPARGRRGRRARAGAAPGSRATRHGMRERLKLRMEWSRGSGWERCAEESGARNGRGTGGAFTAFAFRLRDACGGESPRRPDESPAEAVKGGGVGRLGQGDHRGGLSDQGHGGGGGRRQRGGRAGREAVGESADMGHGGTGAIPVAGRGVLSRGGCVCAGVRSDRGEDAGGSGLLARRVPAAGGAARPGHVPVCGAGQQGGCGGRFGAG
eukprot:ctg_1115.g335